jgi:flagellar motor protein MotB
VRSRTVTWLALPILAASSLALVAGCGGALRHIPAVDDVERVRVSNDAKDSASRAPEVYARAEQERAYALAAQASGDDVAANLHAQRALAAYGHARAVARLAVAVADLADAQKALDDATAQEQTLAASRAKLELDAQELERRSDVARGRLLPATSGEAAGDREAARLTAARSLTLEARLLCGAARLAGAEAGALTEAQTEIERLDARGQKPAAAPAKGTAGEKARPLIDDAGAARAKCLELLTRARRAAGQDDGRTDALLAELSASGGWAPTRDERGVVVTLRGAFAGPKLTDEGQTKLESLGRVAAAHPGFAVQIVVHDAQPLAPKDDADARRADAAAKALVAGGAQAPRVATELAGTRAPVVDPADARVRPRNERVDVVFVVFVAGG